MFHDDIWVPRTLRPVLKNLRSIITSDWGGRGSRRAAVWNMPLRLAGRLALPKALILGGFATHPLRPVNRGLCRRGHTGLKARGTPIQTDKISDNRYSAYTHIRHESNILSFPSAAAEESTVFTAPNKTLDPST